jgi:hypothetical protein
MNEGLEEAAAMRPNYARRFGRIYIGEGTQNQADQKGSLLLIPKRWSCLKLYTHAQG